MRHILQQFNGYLWIAFDILHFGFMICYYVSIVLRKQTGHIKQTIPVHFLPTLCIVL